jgi:hypothetical protein
MVKHWVGPESYTLKYNTNEYMQLTALPLVFPYKCVPAMNFPADELR